MRTRSNAAGIPIISVFNGAWSVGLLLVALPAAPSLAAVTSEIARAWTGAISTEIRPGVTWTCKQFEAMPDVPQFVNVIDADMNSAKVAVRIAVPEGRAACTSIIASNCHALAAVNGAFFQMLSGVSESFLKVGGSTIRNVKHYGPPDSGLILVHSNGCPAIAPAPTKGTAIDTAAIDVLCARPLLLMNGQNVAWSNTTSIAAKRHPRTAVGMTPKNHLILVTVDGRRPESAGMTCNELAILMQSLGCTDALNLDGGGSTTMWLGRGSVTGVVNRPGAKNASGPINERPVSSVVLLLDNPASPAL